MLHQDLLSALEWGDRVGSGPHRLGVRLRNWIWRRGVRLKIWSSPTCFNALLISLADLAIGFLGNACWIWGLERQDKWGGRLEEKIWMICWKWGQRGWEGHSKRLLCYRVGDETGELDVEERSERCWSALSISLASSLARMDCRFPGNASLTWGLREISEWWKGCLGRKICVMHFRWGMGEGEAMAASLLQSCVWNCAIGFGGEEEDVKICS